LAVSTFVAVAALAAAGADEPTPAPTATPSASPVAAPSIILITIAPQPLVPGKPVEVAVQTTGDVVAVHCEVWRHLFEVPKSGPGMFVARGSVPWWARLFHGSFQAVFTAVDADGRTAHGDAVIRI
jgi:hypothetical protein